MRPIKRLQRTKRKWLNPRRRSRTRSSKRVRVYRTSKQRGGTKVSDVSSIDINSNSIFNASEISPKFKKLFKLLTDIKDSKNEFEIFTNVLNSKFEEINSIFGNIHLRTDGNDDDDDDDDDVADDEDGGEDGDDDDDDDDGGGGGSAADDGAKRAGSAAKRAGEDVADGAGGAGSAAKRAAGGGGGGGEDVAGAGSAADDGAKRAGSAAKRAGSGSGADWRISTKF